MEVVVTGGTGFIGGTLTRELAASGHSLRLVVRPGHRHKHEPLPASAALCPVDLESDPQGTQRVFRGADAVIHLVGIISEVGRQTFERVHHELTQRVVAAARAAGVPRLLHMSALGTRPGARSRYHRTKWAAEEVVRQTALRWTIFRPSLIHGPGDHFTHLYARLARWSPLVPVPGPGTNLLEPIAVEQVARAFRVALTHPQAAGGTFDLCGRDRLSFDAAIRTVLDVIHCRRWIVHLPWAVAGFQARLLEILFPALLRRAPPFNTDQLLMLQEHNIGNGRQADAAFGLDHLPFADALRRHLPGQD